MMNIQSVTGCLLRGGLALALMLPLRVLADVAEPFPLPASSEGQQLLPEDLTQVELSQLLNLDLVVTLPGRKEQRVSDIASAVYVLSNDDIRRSGATTIPEALRLVPGVDVARVASNKWAVSIRGFNQVFANKLLVLVDGVSVFSPLTNGVYWEVNEMLLADVERIELIRGPGAALWGANAVNGVVNIVTKSSARTQGWHVEGGGGTHERTFTGVRWGGRLDDASTVRLYGLGRNRAENQHRDGRGAEDDWESYVGGVRIDSDLSEHDKLTFTLDTQAQDDTLYVDAPTTVPPFVDSASYSGDTRWRGVRALGHWQRQLSDVSELDLRVSFGRTERDSQLVSFDSDTLALDAQHRVPVAKSHDLVYGGGYRSFDNATDDSPAHVVQPSKRHTDLVSWFAQDEITIVPDLLRLILGSKFEYNDHTGFEYMPNVRVLATPWDGFTTWGSVARAVAPPAVFFEDVKIPLQGFPIPGEPLPGLAVLTGSRELGSESVLSYEAGIRGAVTPAISFDLALFYSDHDHIYGIEAGAPGVGFAGSPPAPVLEIPLIFDNRLEARSYGGELALEWKIAPWAKVVAGYTYINLDADLDQSTDTSARDLIEGSSPGSQYFMRLATTLSSGVELDLIGRRVGRLSYGDVEGYTQLDARLGVRITDGVTLSVVGQNLLHSAVQEFQGNLFESPPVRIERGVYGVVSVDL